MNRLRSAFAAALLALPFPAAAQPAAPTSAPTSAPASAPTPAPRPWQVDWGDHFCTMIRNAGEGRPFATAFTVVPGAQGTRILLVPEGGAALPAGIDRLVLLPSGRSTAVQASNERRGTTPVVSIRGELGYGFRDLLPEEAELRLQHGDQVRARIPLGGARAAVAAHRRCTAEVAREWRVDEARLLALSHWPDSPNALGFTSDDYPPSALLDRTEGRVNLRITVTADGRAADCEVVVSSGSPTIDRNSCRVATTRGRFRPGRDAAGRPVTIPSIFNVTWVIER